MSAASKQGKTRPHWLPVLLFLLVLPASAGADFIEDLVERFSDSEIRFARGRTNVPFPPVAYLDFSVYGDAEVELPSGLDLVFDQQSVSQGAFLPILAGKRDMLFIGEYLAWADFSTKGDIVDSFDVLSAGLPMGWLHQSSDEWQTLAFVMPLGHRASIGHSSWTMEYMGGVFGRYVHNDSLWWVFGAFADVAPGSNLYLPYIGASLQISERWTVSAILPWPSIMYAPSPDTLFRLGISPSGASWAIDPDLGEATADLGGWDLGLSAEHRVAGNAWLRAEAGVSGLRGLTFEASGVESPDFDYGSSWYASVSLNLRPSVP